MAAAKSDHKPDQKFGREARWMTSLFSLIVAVLLVLWFYWDEEWLSNDDDLLYDMGLIGGILMLSQFLYSMRKRIGGMRSLGKLKIWFVIHAVVGLLSPILIVVHSRFDIQSINGGVAFFSMLLVVFSGVVGRYLYSQVNLDLAGSRVELKEWHAKLQQKVLQPHPEIGAEVEQQLRQFMVASFSPTKHLFDAVYRSLTMGIRTQILYYQLCQIQAVSIAAEGMGNVEMANSGLGGRERKILRQYLRILAKLARYNAYKRLFSLWRVGHVPVIFLLLITGLAHVLAVHMY